MRYILILMAMFCYLPKLAAQNLSFGILAGPGSRNISYGSSNVLKSPDFSADASFLVNWQFSNHFSLQPSVAYSAQGSKKGPFISPIGYDPLEYPNEVKFAQLNYLMLPVLIKAGWWLGPRSPMRFNIGVGPYAAYLLSATQVLITPSQQKISGTGVDVESELRNFNTGLEGNIGLAYMFHRSSIFVQAGGDYSFLQIQKDQSLGGNYAGAASLLIGYSLCFGENSLTSDHITPIN